MVARYPLMRAAPTRSIEKFSVGYVAEAGSEEPTVLLASSFVPLVDILDTL